MNKTFLFFIMVLFILGTGCQNKEAAQTELSPETPVVLYHTSTNEDSLSEIKKIGNHLEENLKENNIGVSNLISTTAQQDQNNEQLSKQVIKEELTKNENVQILFDIQQADVKTKNNASTTEIKGKNAARVLFELSSSTDNYVKNQKFAKKIHAKIEEMYPGLSRGVITKKSHDFDYNQELHPNLLLLKIGGQDTTLKEEYRTMDLLTEVIQEVLDEIE
ncbi:stage II sporulation protein P [Bacillus piscicola]|uniref:stage II sporulation protein P n=1 Tax=Bacillus piscicola TaxID=1632684 RepID=UPI001F08E0A6|nr:stage II sporulation protein P [Bacillus piscicola]